jgi:site-specific DNA-methyltransferase (adenine-specific)
MKSPWLMQGDCLERMKEIPDGSVDMVLCDLPYGTTKNAWDVSVDLPALWGHYNRIVKKRGCIALFAQTPFDKILGASNLKMLKHEWIWEKPIPTGRLNCKFAPLKVHENILIFSKSAACYVKDADNAMVYNPQMGIGKPYKTVSGKASTNYDTKWCKQSVTINDGTRYPRDVIRFSHDKERYHPTQKPVALLEYLIRTYTNKGETVLDNCMGSGSTGVACVNTGRKFIGIELNEDYFKVASERINGAKLPLED